MKNKFRILLALTLALVMVFGNVLTVAAEGEITQPIKVENGKTYVYNPETDNWDEVEYSEAESITVDGPNALNVKSNDDAESSSFTVTGDVDASWKTYDVFAVTAEATGGGNAEATVQGNVSSSSEHTSYPYSFAVNVYADGEDSSAAVTVNGDVSAYAKNEDGGVKTIAVDVRAEDGAEAKATVNGKAITEAEGGEAGHEIAARIVAEDEATADVTIGEGAEGQVFVRAGNGSTANVTIEKDGIKTDAPAYSEDGFYGASAALTIANNYSEVNATIGEGGITANGTAVSSSTLTGSNYRPGRNDWVDSPAPGNRLGVPSVTEDVNTPAPPPAVTTIKLTGDISIESKAEDHENDGYYNEYGLDGISLYNQGEKATTDFSLEGNLTLNDDGEKAVGLSIQNGESIPCPFTGKYYAAGTMNVAVKGNIAVTGADESNGVEVAIAPFTSYNLEESEMVKLPRYDEEGYEEFWGTLENEGYDLHHPEDVQYVTDDEGDTIGQLVWYTNGETTRCFAYSMDGTFEVLDLKEEYTENKNTVLVEGDITADTNGIVVDAKKGAKGDLVFDGTVGGQEAGIVLVGETKIDKDLTLTVWKLDGKVLREEAEEEDDYYHLGVSGEEEESPVKTSENEDDYKTIQYIIRIKEDEDTQKSFKFLEGATGSLNDDSLSGKYKDRIAREGDVVTVNLEAPEGYEIVEAVANAEGLKLTKIGEGKYQLTVKRGGGYEIAVTLKQLPKPEPEPEPEADTVTITYVLGNETKFDHIRIPSAVGGNITLSDAPEREGYTFLYWQGTDVDPQSPYYREPDPENDFQFRPGASYTATKDYNFVAVWKKN